MRIFINPGHGGSDPGAVSAVKEKDLNLSVALHLKKQLMYIGFTVICSREDDSTVSMEDAVKMANDWFADVFISIHHNAGQGDGAEVYHSVIYGVGRDLALMIGDEFLKIGQNIRHITARASTIYDGQDYYYVIKYTNMPAVITEFAFIDNPADLSQIDEIHEQKAEANAIAKALCRHAGVEFLDAEAVITLPEINYQAKYEALLNGLQGLYNAYKTKE